MDSVEKDRAEIIEGTRCQKTVPPVAFLGFLDRVKESREGHPAFWGLHILGLSLSKVFAIFPNSLGGLGFAAAIYDPLPQQEIKLAFRGKNKEPEFKLSMKIDLKAVSSEGAEEAFPDIAGPPGWHMIASQLGSDVWVNCPGIYEVFLESESYEAYLGAVTLAHAPVAPLDLGDIAAIKADPLASKFIRLAMSCKECGGSLKCYTGIERSTVSEGNGYTWSQELPIGAFTCSCGKLSFDLQYLRTGLHGLLRRNLHPSTSDSISNVRLYEKTALEQTLRDFLSLISIDSKEEVVQKFLEANPIFFHIFSPKKLFFKPRILTKYVADFGLLNERNELVLIEIERPQIRLVKKDGGNTADLEHAFHQIRTWVQEVNDHRSAVLSSLGLDLIQVARVRGIVIAGRNPQDESHLKLLRSVSTADIEFYTFDDLLNSVTELLKHVASV